MPEAPAPAACLLVFWERIFTNSWVTVFWSAELVVLYWSAAKSADRTLLFITFLIGLLVALHYFVAAELSNPRCSAPEKFQKRVLWLPLTTSGFLPFCGRCTIGRGCVYYLILAAHQRGGQERQQK